MTLRHYMIYEEFDARQAREERGLQTRLASAIALGDVDVVESGDVEDLIEAWRDLRQLARDTLPSLRCWVVVKHYSPDMPMPWLGCLNEAQARELAAVLQEHYVQFGDEFKVERGTIAISDVIRPGVTGADYVAILETD